RSVLQRRSRARRIVHAEHDRIGACVRELADLRVVAVQRQHGVAGQRAYGGAPTRGDVLELAVAVELVAEEVSQADGPGPQPLRHLRESRLVDLEQAELRAPCTE